MKQLLPIIALLITLVSCSKENITAPQTISVQSSAPISYSSANIAIAGFKAATASQAITVGFTTTFQKNIKTLEILRGTTPNNLCSIYKTDGNISSNASLQYTTADDESASVVYYMVKYTLTDNDWGYTPVFTLANGSTSSF